MSHREGFEFHILNHAPKSSILLKVWPNMQIFAFWVICPNDFEAFLRNSGDIVLPWQKAYPLSNVHRDPKSLRGHD